MVIIREYRYYKHWKADPKWHFADIRPDYNLPNNPRKKSETLTILEKPFLTMDKSDHWMIHWIRPPQVTRRMNNISSFLNGKKCKP